MDTGSDQAQAEVQAVQEHVQQAQAQVQQEEEERRMASQEPLPMATSEDAVQAPEPGQPAGGLGSMHELATTMDLHTFIRQLPRDPIRARFEFVDSAGRGSHGIVYRAKHRESGALVAIKEVHLPHGARSREVQHLHQEIYYHSLCRHPHIVTLHTVYVNESADGFTYYFVMELLTGGELFDRLKSARRFTEADASRITRNLAAALQYMHQRGIAHRDLKPENIMLSHKGCDPWDLKIIDFGFARTGPMTTPLGSGFYISPEIIQAYQSRLKYRFLPGRPVPFTYHTQTDMWTLGVIIFILLTGRPPFRRGQQRWWEDSTLRHSILQQRYRFKPEENVSRMAQDLVASLLRLDPKERFTADEVLLHPWLNDVQDLAARDLASPRRLREEEAQQMFQQVREDISQAREQIEHLHEQRPSKAAKGFGGAFQAKKERKRMKQKQGQQQQDQQRQSEHAQTQQEQVQQRERQQQSPQPPEQEHLEENQ